jgi:hypothetical protein
MFNDQNVGHDYFFRSTDGGTTWTQQCANCQGGNRPLFIGGAGSFNAQLRSITGHAGILLLTAGPQYPGSHPNGQPFYITTDGGSTWSAVRGITDVWSFGEGKACGEASFSIFIYGAVNNTMGVYRGDYSGEAFIWTKISNAFPNDTLDSPDVVSGDNNVCGTVYIGFSNSGFALRTNFLLRRDMDPASEDNAAVFLDLAA